MDIQAYLEAYNKQTDDFLKVHRMFAERVLEFGPSQRGVVTNGQVNNYKMLFPVIKLDALASKYFLQQKKALVSTG